MAPTKTVYDPTLEIALVERPGKAGDANANQSAFPDSQSKLKPPTSLTFEEKGCLGKTEAEPESKAALPECRSALPMCTTYVQQECTGYVHCLRAGVLCLRAGVHCVRALPMCRSALPMLTASVHCLCAGVHSLPVFKDW
eukprot:1157816-Pelagomonas_calceolata.AAC.6